MYFPQPCCESKDHHQFKSNKLTVFRAWSRPYYQHMKPAEKFSILPHAFIYQLKVTKVHKDVKNGSKCYK